MMINKPKVFGDIDSGNCYKVKLLLELLSIDHDWEHVDILAGESQTAGFRRMNTNAKIPVLQISSDEYLAESNAILFYLAEGSRFLPEDRLQKARVLQWQFFEQYSHEPYIAVARFINFYLGLPDDRKAEYDEKQAGGHRALSVMEKALAEEPFLVGKSATIADFSLYAYTHVADEGGFDLTVYPAIGAWIDRIEALGGFMSMADAKAAT